MFNIQVLKKGRKYVNDPLLRDLISYWKLNEASGTRADSVGDNDLTDNNTVTRVVGKQSGAAQFVLANSEYLSVTSNSSLNIGTSSFTLATWVYLSSKATQMGIITKWPTGGTGVYFIDYLNSSDRFRFRVTKDGGTSATAIADNLGAPSTGTWYFIVCTFDGTNLSIQVNNGTADTATLAGTTVDPDNADPFYLGRFSGTTPNYLDGYVDEVGFWKRLLDSEEKARLYNSGSGITYPFNSILDRLVSYWAMEQTSGNRTDSNLAVTLVDNNTVTYGAGIIRNGAQFASANSEYLSTVSADTALFSFGDADYTLAFWVNLDSLGASQNVLSKYSSDTVRDYFIQYVTGSDFFRFIVYDGATNTIGLVASAAGVSTGTWYFVVAYHDATNNLVGISVNGAAPTTAATTGTAASTASLFYAGGRQGGAALQYMDGRADEVGVWRRVLTNAEIAYLYNNGKGKTYPLSSPMSQV